MSRVMAKGLSMSGSWEFRALAVSGEESEPVDVVVGSGLDPRDDVRTGVLPEQVREALLQLEVLLDRDLMPDLGDLGDLTVLGLEHRQEAGLLDEPGEPDRVLGGGPPAQRAGHEDMQVAGAAEGHRLLDLVL